MLQNINRSTETMNFSKQLIKFVCLVLVATYSDNIFARFQIGLQISPDIFCKINRNVIDIVQSDPSQHSNLLLSGIGKVVQRLGLLDNDDLTQGHTKRISSLACSADKKFLVSGAEDKTISIYARIAHNTWQLLQRLGDIDQQNPSAGHSDSILEINIAQDDTITSHSVCEVIVWQKDTERDFWQMTNREEKVTPILE